MTGVRSRKAAHGRVFLPFRFGPGEGDEGDACLGQTDVGDAPSVRRKLAKTSIFPPRLCPSSRTNRSFLGGALDGAAKLDQRLRPPVAAGDVFQRLGQCPRMAARRPTAALCSAWHCGPRRAGQDPGNRSGGASRPAFAGPACRRGLRNHLRRASAPPSSSPPASAGCAAQDLQRGPPPPQVGSPVPVQRPRRPRGWAIIVWA